ncbi:MAG: substrate-binding domain-containing protein [Coriobacteriales bacterium]|jgi:phosphate transport system substrate-binding protein|nr:substrate-binding domain-containing protein [Coriobacteriales bacterium]
MKFLTKIVAALTITALLTLGFGCASPDNGSATNDGTNASGTGADASNSSTPTGTINIIAREDGSGTRSAFAELFEVQVESADGQKVDGTTASAIVTNSTSVMMTTVAGDPNAIGYLSLGSLNDTVRAVPIDGVEATTANVKSGTYRVSRPFNIVTTSAALSPEAQDFITFILSADGQAVIVENNYIAVDDSAPAYQPTAGLSGKVVLAGSSSVSPVMEMLGEAYELANPDVNIEIQTSDSGTGITSVLEGICDIGMSSRELKDSETSQGAAATTIAIDGIAVIVNNANGIAGLTSEQVKGIYLGETTTWDAL